MLGRYVGLDLFKQSLGVAHGDELMVMWISKMIPLEMRYTEEDKMAGDNLLQLWTNFAKTSNPTPNKEQFGLEWERYPFYLQFTLVPSYQYISQFDPFNVTESRDHPQNIWTFLLSWSLSPILQSLLHAYRYGLAYGRSFLPGGAWTGPKPGKTQKSLKNPAPRMENQKKNCDLKAIIP